MPTFASTYTEPGTYVKVINQTTPPAIVPAFVTALVGTSATDKPVSKTLTRDKIIVGNETIRRDTLDTTVTTVGTPVVDANGLSWDVTNSWQSITVSSTTYIEWAAQYSPFITVPGVTALPFTGTTLNAGTVVITIDDTGGALDYRFRLIKTTGGLGVTGTATLEISNDGGTNFGAAVTVTPSGGTFGLTTFAGGFQTRASVDLTPGGVLETTLQATDATGGPVTIGTDTVVVTTSGPNPLGTVYTVDYRKAKTLTDLDPQRFDSLSDLQSFHGLPQNDSINFPEVSNAESLSVAAVAYFGQSGGSVIAVPVRDKKIDPANGYDIYNVSQPVADAAWVGAMQEALAKLENVAEVSLVIPLTPTEKSVSLGDFRPGVYSAVINHVNNMSSVTNAKPRMAILGARANSVAESTFIDSANFAANKRIVYMAPATATLTVAGDAGVVSSKLVNGSTIAAAVAGILSNPDFNAGEPISGKQVTVFDSLPDPFSREQKNRIGGVNGVTVIEINRGTPTVRHFLTTDPSSVLNAEAKVTKIEIDTRRTLKQALDATLINTRLVDGATVATTRSIISLVLNQKISDQVINAFRITKIAKNSVDPRQLDVELEVKPTLDLNWIYIQATFLAS